MQIFQVCLLCTYVPYVFLSCVCCVGSMIWVRVCVPSFLFWHHVVHACVFVCIYVHVCVQEFFACVYVWLHVCCTHVVLAFVWEFGWVRGFVCDVEGRCDFPVFLALSRCLNPSIPPLNPSVPPLNRSIPPLTPSIPPPSSGTL